MASDVYNNLPC